MLNEITNFYEISPLLGTSGQPRAEQFIEVRAAGYEVVINLATADSPESLSDEASLVRNLGMEYIHIPVIWEQPTRADLQQFFNQMDALEGRKIYVHCAMNMRVSAFVFLYRVLRKGVAQEDARRELEVIWNPSGVWETFVQTALEDLKPVI